jgi:hypothetical protein
MLEDGKVYQSRLTSCGRLIYKYDSQVPHIAFDISVAGHRQQLDINISNDVTPFKHCDNASCDVKFLKNDGNCPQCGKTLSIMTNVDTAKVSIAQLGYKDIMNEYGMQGVLSQMPDPPKDFWVRVKINGRFTNCYLTSEPKQQKAVQASDVDALNALFGFKPSKATASSQNPYDDIPF